MELVIRWDGDEFTMNIGDETGVPVSDKALSVWLYFMFPIPQLCECIETLLGTGKLVLARNPADAVLAVEKVRREAAAAEIEIVKAKNAICELLVSLGNTTPALNEHIAVLHGIAQEGK